MFGALTFTKSAVYLYKKVIQKALKKKRVMKNAKNTTALEISSITSQAGRNCAEIINALASDSRFIPVNGICKNMQVASVAALIDVREESVMPEHYVAVSIDGRRIGTAETLEGVTNLISKCETCYVDLSMVNSWDTLEMTRIKGIDVQGGQLMKSYKAGVCDFTGRAFSKGSGIIWFSKTKKVRAI